MSTNVASLLEKLKSTSPEELLKYFLDRYGSGIALASSLGAEDQALTDMIMKINPDARIFFIDTGRLHQETYDTADRTMKKYGLRYEVFFPKTAEVESMLSASGPNLFYDSIELRKECCKIRKINPLKRILSNLNAWITGLRAEQAVTRSSVDRIERDNVNNIIKINPLAHWTNEDVWNYIKSNNVPYNVLHDKGFPSIGCAPCTGAVKDGEDIRSGRWWWEKPEQRECGLHFRNVNEEDKNNK